MQRLLPKVHGSRRQVEPMLTKILSYAQGDRLLSGNDFPKRTVKSHE